MKKKSSWVLLTALLGTLPAAPACAQISADFTGGNSSSIVDAWRGIPGDGWVNNWQVPTNANTTLTATVTKATPLTPTGGNYLQYTVVNGSPDLDRSGSVSRQYGDHADVNLAGEHTLTFELRMDTAPESLKRFVLFDSQEFLLTPFSEGTFVTWLIRSQTNGNIQVYNGTSAVATGMALAQGNAYRFTIRVRPSATAADSSYTVQIENLTSQASYESGPLQFYTAQTAVGGTLNFVATVPTGNQATFSLDSIHIGPDPSPAAPK